MTCRDPSHAPDGRPRPPGLYMHRCPACGERSSFVVRAPRGVALAALALAFAAACGRGSDCPAPRHPVASQGDATAQPSCIRQKGGLVP